MANKKVKLVELNEIPKQNGTEFVIIYYPKYMPNTLKSTVVRIDNGDVRRINESSCKFNSNDMEVLKILSLPHAELRALYEEKNCIPYNFEYLQQLDNDWRVCEREPSWLLDVEYRYNPRPKQKHILINNEIVPEPIKHRLEVGERYYFVDLNYLSADSIYWDNDLEDKRRLEAGCIHKTRDNAQKHLDALIKANNQEGIYLND